MSFSVILPTLNEKGHIIELIEEIAKINLFLSDLLIFLRLKPVKRENFLLEILFF